MPSRPPRWLTLALPVLLAVPAAAAPRPKRQARVYDPEIALLVLNLQKESLPLLTDELKRQCEWLGLPGVKVLLDHTADEAVRDVTEDLAPDSDVLEGFRGVLVRYHPSLSREIDTLIGEVRRYHGLKPGPPLTKLKVTPSQRLPRLIREAGAGSDVENSLFGSQVIREPAAAAQRRFGSTGPFLSRRRWNTDFYMGEFRDLVPYYWKLGYRTFYRLRAPYITYAKEAYVLAPEGDLRPRLVYCGFFGRDYFRHVRAQYALLLGEARQEATDVQTLQCPDCPFTHPGVKALRALLQTVPYTARTVLMGYTHLFEESLARHPLGCYENDYWRICYHDMASGVAATLSGRHTGFGEVSALALEEMARRGAQDLFYAGPAAQTAADAPANSLQVPREFLDSEGAPIPLANSLSLRRSASGRHQSVASPLFVTDEWLESARRRRVETVDCEAAVIAERIARLNSGAGRGQPVRLGVALIGSDLSWLHPDEDRAVYTVEYETMADREKAKSAYRDAVLGILGRPAKKAPR